MARLQKFPTLSIVIPTLNEAIHLPLLLADLNAWPYDFELTIVDGGSIDLTISIAEIQGVDVIKSNKKNRGYQLKTGAYNSKGEWLLFLHADSRLSPSWVKRYNKIKHLYGRLKHIFYNCIALLFNDNKAYFSV